jgi:hypothetical protein
VRERTTKGKEESKQTQAQRESKPNVSANFVETKTE